MTDRRFWRRSIGSEQRIANLLLHLCRRDLSVAVGYVGRATRDDRAAISTFRQDAPGLEVVTRPADPRSLLRGTRPALRRAFVRSLVEARRPRIVIVEFLRLTHTIWPRPKSACSPVYWIDTHDLMHRRAERYRRAGARVAWEIEADEEIRSLARYDAIMAIQSVEAAAFRHLLPETYVLVVPHGLEVAKEPARATERVGPTRLGFLGGRDESNRRALEWFLAEVWPALRTRFGEGIELRVAGQVCRAWHPRAEGVVEIGPIESIDDFWPEIDIAVNPVRFGSGLKIKNVEALAYGRPLVTTPIGAEGLEAASPHGLCIANGRLEWQRVLDLWLSDGDVAARVGRHARKHAEAHLSARAAFRELDRMIAATLGGTRP